MESVYTSFVEFFESIFTTIFVGGSLLMPVLCLVLAALWLYFIRIHIAYKMAKNRHRDPLGWVLLSLFVSPLLVWIILLIVGDSDRI